MAADGPWLRHLARLTLLAGVALAIATTGSAWAEPQRYAVRLSDSLVRVAVGVAGQTASAEMPIREGQAWLDLQRIDQGRIAVAFDTGSAMGSSLLTTEIMRGTGFLDAARFPQAHFRSTALRPLGAARVLVQGDLTLRGVTRPVVLDAQVMRPADSGQGALSVLLHGRLERDAFGITGLGGLVANEVLLTVLVRLDPAP